MNRMSGFLKSPIAAAVVAAVGVALFVFGFARAWELGTVERQGQSEIGLGTGTFHAQRYLGVRS